MLLTYSNPGINYNYFYHYYFNDYLVKDIPIILNNYNRLSTTKKLADDLYNLGYTNIHILDNQSTYPPLLEYYKVCPYKVVLLDANMEHLAVYNSGYINNFLHLPWIVYSDPDLEVFTHIPENFIQILIDKAEKYAHNKAGLALSLDGLPDNEYANHYHNWEQRYWQKELEKDVYEAHVDTTFCIIKPGECFDYRAIRVAGNLTAKHVPWFVDFNNLDEEETYYLEHSGDWSTYKRFYSAYIKSKNETI
jgi:hypothetical protein